MGGKERPCHSEDQTRPQQLMKQMLKMKGEPLLARMVEATPRGPWPAALCSLGRGVGIPAPQLPSCAGAVGPRGGTKPAPKLCRLLGVVVLEGPAGAGGVGDGRARGLVSRQETMCVEAAWA